MNIQEIKNLQDGSWVQGPISGTISSAKNMTTKTGKNMSVAKLGDESGTVDITSFDKDFHRIDGKAVTFAGQGLKKESYNGYDKLMIGNKAIMTVDGGEQPATQPKQAPAQSNASGTRLEQMEEKYLACLKSANSVAADVHEVLELGPSEIKDIATTFFIQLNR